MAQRLSHDTRLPIGGQAVRGLGYGFTSTVLGATLARCGVGTVRAGILLTVLIAASAAASFVVGPFADCFGRRRRQRRDDIPRAGDAWRRP